MLALALAACGDDSTVTDGGVVDGGTEDARAPDAGAPDAGPTPCDTEGTLACSADGYRLERCEGGFLVTEEDCIADRGMLCEDGACIEPWRYGSPTFDSCASDPRATVETLAEKAAWYDDIATRVHLHPQLKWIMGVTLRDGVAQEDATFADVEQWHTGENDGLWSALYLASQAYRYAATHDAAALATIRTLLEGEVDRMRITGVRGLFTRQYIPPGVDGIACPTDLADYVPDVEKDDNQWVRVGVTGCLETVDATTMEWVTSSVCGLDHYAGWCWLDNVSKDEYSGHVWALGVVWQLVDDGAVHAVAADLLTQVGEHLRNHDLTVVDWDGRITEHGRLYAYALDDFPGFNAAMALSFVKTAAVASGDASIAALYECLLTDPKTCLPYSLEAHEPYTERLDEAGVWVGPDACGTNFNNVSMQFLSLFGAIGFERDPARREAYQASLARDVFMPEGVARAAFAQNNPWFDFMYAVAKRLGPGSDGPATDAVENGLCMLRQFPARYDQPTRSPPGTELCLDRFGDPVTRDALETADRCPSTFLWWRDPFDYSGCTADPRNISPPQSYLLPYWMARYYGLV